MRKIKVKIISGILFSILIIALSSCKMRAEQKSLTSHFEIIDSFISDGDFKAALKELKNLEKLAYDAWAYIGIYKRYIQLCEEDRAEKVLKKALKKNKHNEELIAVYSDFLLRHNRLSEAAKRAEELRGGKYGSLFSEAVLRIEQEKTSAFEHPEYYKESKFYEIYFDAYKARNNPMWLRNCAVYHLIDGSYERAASIAPGSYSEPDDAYFWAMVMYDAAHYYDCAAIAEVGIRLLDNLSPLSNYKINPQTHPDVLHLAALESDAYLAVAEVEKAQEARSVLFTRLEDYENPTEEQSELLKLLAINSAIYANSVDDDVVITDMLSYVTSKWPEYEKGLILYADYAYRSNLMREEDMEVQALRKAGLKTLEMERYDSRRKLPMDNAIAMIDSAVEKEINPELLLLQLDVKYKLDTTYTVKQKTADLWKLLESSNTDEKRFYLEIVEYALSFLINTNQYDDAYELFYKYISKTYDFNIQESFWTQVGSILPRLEPLIAEYAAYFAARQKLYDETIRFYEYCVFESGGMNLMEKEGATQFVSPYVSNASVMNLADIYYSIGKKDRAIDLYGAAAGRENGSYRKSDIFYRLALVYESSGDKKSALRALEYSIDIYPANARSALLKDKLNKE